MEHSNQNIANVSNVEANEKIEIDLAQLLPKLPGAADLSFTCHPMYTQLWNAKATKYNAMTKQLRAAGVDLQVLFDYVTALEEYTRVELEHAHDTGFIRGAAAMAMPEEEGVVHA